MNGWQNIMFNHVEMSFVVICLEPAMGSFLVLLGPKWFILL